MNFLQYDDIGPPIAVCGMYRIIFLIGLYAKPDSCATTSKSYIIVIDAKIGSFLHTIVGYSPNFYNAGASRAPLIINTLIITGTDIFMTVTNDYPQTAQSQSSS